VQVYWLGRLRKHLAEDAGLIPSTVERYLRVARVFVRYLADKNISVQAVETPVLDFSESIPASAPTPPTQAEQQKWRDWRESNAHVSRPAVGSIPIYFDKGFDVLKEGERVKAIKKISYIDWTNGGLEVRKRPGFGIHTSYIVETPDGRQGYVKADYVLLDNGVRCNESGCSKSQVRENAKDGLKYVWIPPGTFMMGCSPGDSKCGPEEKPPHQVTITKGFWLGQTEVTVGAYKRFAAGTEKAMPTAPGFNTGWSNEQMPIGGVTWDDAKAFCAWAGGRLPTEAEWEYAARGGSTEARYEPIAGSQKTREVGQKGANGFGLYDVLGNVVEWVNDWYDQNYYQKSPSQDPRGPASGQGHIVRGGSWADERGYVRVSHRAWVPTGYTSENGDDGFRCIGEASGP
jgi:formylglycine-generating enzyme required for sulfatase activity